MPKQRDRVQMTAAEVENMLASNRKVQLATISPDGYPHLVTMYYTLVDGKIAFWTYRTSQKALNLARDPRISCLVETGQAYFDLRGVQIQGTVETIIDPDVIYRIGLAVGNVVGNASAGASAVGTGAAGRCGQRVRGQCGAEAVRLHRRAGPRHLLGPHQVVRPVARSADAILRANPLGAVVRGATVGVESRFSAQ